MKKTYILSLAFALISGFSLAKSGSAQATLDSGLVAYYPLNGNAMDSSGNENNGIINGNITFGNDGVKNYAHFDGNSYITVAPSSSMSFSSGFSINFWTKIDNSPTNYGTFFAKDGDDSGNNTMFAAFTPVVSNDSLNPYSSFGINRGYFPLSQLGTWQNMTFVVSDTNYYVYCNGILISQSSGTAPNWNSINTRNLYFGAIFTSFYLLVGELNDIHIYNRALQQNEITALATKPAVFASNNIALCSGSTYTLPKGEVISNAGTYVDTLQSVSGGDSVITTNVTVYNVPQNQTGISASLTTICAGQSTLLTASGADVYVWGNGTIADSIQVSPQVSTTYYVSPNGCATALDSITITVAPPAVTVSASKTTACLGDAVTITASGASSYLWCTSSTDSSIVVTPASTSTYTVSPNGCTTPLSIIIAVDNPKVSVISSQQLLCQGASDTLIASGSLNYVWSTGDNTASIVVNPMLNSIYYVTGTDVYGCVDSTSIGNGIVRWNVAQAAGTNIYSPAVDKNGVIWAADNNSDYLEKFDGTSWTSYPPNDTNLTYQWVDFVQADPQGNMYISTDAGVYKYDGTSFTVFYNQPAIATADKLGYVWLLTHDKSYNYTGLYKSDGTTVTNYTPTTIDPSTIVNLTVDASGNPWITYGGNSGGGLDPVARYDGSQWVTINPSNYPSGSVTQTSLWNGQLGADSKGNVYIINSSNSFYKTNGTTWQLITYGIGSISSELVIDKQDNVWTSDSQNGGMLEYTNGLWKSFTQANSGLGENNVQNIFENASGTIFANGSNTVSSVAGSYSFRATRPVVSFTLNPDTLCLGGTTTITATGGASYLWSTGATTNTISVTPTLNSAYLVTTTDACGSTAISNVSKAWTVSPSNNSNVYNPVVDKNGRIWGNNDGSIMTYTASNLWTNYDSLTYSSFYSLAADNQGNVYAATDAGVSEYDGSYWSLIDGTSWDVVNSGGYPVIYPDNNGNLWTANSNGGAITKFTGGYSQDYTPQNLNINSFYGGAQSITVDANGNPWIAYTDNSSYNSTIAKYNGSQWIAFDPSNYPNLCSECYFTLAADSKGNVYISDGNGDIYETDGTTWQSLSYNNTYLAGLLVDNNNNMWTSDGDNGGLIEYTNGQWQEFTTSNSGIGENYISNIFANRYGNVYVNGNSTISEYNSNSFSFTSTKPLVKLTINPNPLCSGGVTTIAATGAASYVWSTGVSTNAVSVSPTVNSIYSVTATDVHGCSVADTIVSASKAWTVYPTNLQTFTVVVDKNGSMWTNVEGGLQTYNATNLWSTNNTLQYNTVYSLASDVQGNVYAATDAGVSEYNGSSWSLFDGTSWDAINSGGSPVMYPDNNGNLWTANSNNGAITKINGSGISQDYTPQNLDISYMGGEVQSLTVDANGNPWIVYINSNYMTMIAQYNGTLWNSFNQSNYPNLGGGTTTMASDSKGNVYILGNGSLYESNGSTWQQLQYNGDYLAGLVVDRNDNVWTSDNDDGGLLEYTNGQWTRLTPQNSGIGENYISNIFEDANSNVYVNGNITISKFNINSFSFNNSKPIVPVKTNPSTICQGATVSLVASGAKSYVWSTGNNSDSVSVIPTPSDMYTLTATDSLGCVAVDSVVNATNGWSATSISGLSNQLTSIVVDKNGVMWGLLASEGYLLAKYDGQEWVNYPPSDTTIQAEVFSSLTSDSKGNLYAASYDYGNVYEYNGTSWNLLTSYQAGLLNTDNKGSLWLTNESGTTLEKLTNGVTQDYTPQNIDLSEARITSIVTDATGNPWILIYYGDSYKVAKYDGSQWNTLDGSNYPNLDVNYATATLTADSKGFIYIVGLNVIYKTNGTTWQQLTDNNTTLGGLVIDNNDNVWTSDSQNGGLLQYNSNGQWNSFTTANSGLKENIINYLSVDEWGNVYAIGDTTASKYKTNSLVFTNNKAALAIKAIPAEVCDGSNTTINATGAVSYAWSTGETTSSITFTPDFSSVYTVTATDAYACTNVDTITSNLKKWNVVGTSQAMYAYAVDKNGVSWGVDDDNDYLWKLVGQQWIQSSVIPYNWIDYITTDINGNMYVSTNQSVYKYDGTTWSLYYSSQAQVISDKKGTIWLLTYNSDYNNTGLLKSDGATWDDFTPTVTDPSHIQTVTIDSKGNPWITYSSENIILAQYNGKQWNTFDQSNYPDGLNSLIVADSKGNVYAQSKNNSIYVTDGTTWNTISYSSGQLSSLAIDKDNAVWSSDSQNGGLIAYNNGTWQTFTTSNSGLGENYVDYLYNDINGNIVSIGNYTISKYGYDIKVDSIPNVSVSSNPAFICKSQQVSLSGAGAFTYNWSTGDSTATITLTPDSTKSYAVTGTSEFGCSSTGSISVVVPQINVSTSQDTVCAGSPVSMTATGGISYSWDNGTQIAANNVTPTVTTKYFVTVATNNGCSILDSITITAKQPTASSITKTACNSYTLNDSIYTATGIYTQHFTNAAGCDSVVTLNLTINKSDSVNISKTACNSYTWNAQTYLTSGAYLQTLTNALGCDSVVTLNLTINKTDSVNIAKTACNSYTWNAQTYLTSGTYLQTLTNALGCDSVVTLNLTINKSDSVNISKTACNSYTWNAQTYLTSGTYLQTLTNALGCDSVVTLNLTINKADSVNISKTACNSYTWNAQTYLTSGTYLQTLTNALGCDSVVTLNLTINKSDSVNISKTACNSYTWNAQTYLTSGTYLQTLTNALGCDSVVTLNLTINKSDSVNISKTACNSYTWNAQTYLTSGTYLQTLTNALGCDSVVTLNLTINKSDSVNISKTACNSYTWNAQTYLTSGTYLQTLTNALGCDSVVTLNLTINKSDSVNISKTACNSYTWNAQTYLTSGTYLQTLTNALGCDSVVTLNLTINKSDSVNISKTACNSYTWNAQTYLTSGNYQQTLTNALGCDSVVTLNLTINKSDSVNISKTACNSYTWNAQTYLTSGIYNQTLTNALGCDSVVTLNLTINKSDSVNISKTACNSYTWNAQTYLTSGTYSQTLTNALGCDSVVTLNLTINKSDSVNISKTACNSYTWNAQTYLTSGNYQQTLTNALGCDSVVTLNLTINKADSVNISKTACNSYTWNAQTYLTSGTYLQTLTNALGCDSVVTLNLTINKSDSVNISKTACNSYTWNAQTYLTSGTYLQTLTNALGCDSVVTLNLTINKSDSVNISKTACNSYTWNAQTYLTSGNYQQTLTNALGCDSVVTLNLTINKSDSVNISKTACNSYTWNAQTYLTSGNYQQTLTNALGCDSVVTLNLTINPIPTVSASNNAVPVGGAVPTLTAVGSNITWYDSTGTKILLDSSNTYTPLSISTSAVGTFYFKVTNTVDGCKSAPETVSLAIMDVPILVITSPEQNAYKTASSMVTIQAQASKAGGTIANVAFSVNGVNIGTVTTAPYSINWQVAGNDSAIIKVVATDNLGYQTIATDTVWINRPPYLIQGAIPEQIALSADSLFAPINLSAYIKDDFTPLADLHFTFADTTNLFSLSVNNGLLTVIQTNNTWTGTTGITMQVTDSEGLLMQTQLQLTQPYLKVKPLKAPTGSFYASKTFVKPNEVIRLYTSSSNADTISWNFNGGNQVSGADVNPSISFDSTGVYSITMTATNSIGSTPVTKKNYIIVSTLSIKDTTICKGNSLTINTIAGFTSYLWNTNPAQTTSSITVSPSTTTKYTVTMTKGASNKIDSVTVTIPPQPNLGNDTTFCQGGSLPVSPHGTFVSYYWNGQLTEGDSTYTATKAGIISVKTVDQYNCVAYDTMTIGTLYPKPEVNLGNDATFCWKNSLTLNAGNAGVSYKWNTGATTKTIVADTTKTYSVTVTDSKTCTNSDTINIKVTVPVVPHIGLVTLSSDSSDSGKNLVAWEPQNNAGIQLYHVWKLSNANKFEIVDTVNKGSLTVFVDQNSNPVIKSDQYALTTVDSACRNESALSAIHNSIHLSCVLQNDSTVVATWNNYIGIPVSTYIIYRAKKGETLSTIDRVPAIPGSAPMTYTDNNSGLNYYYQIGFDVAPQIVLGDLKSDTGPFSQSLSNMAESQLTGVTETALDAAITVYPNPATSYFVVNARENAQVNVYTADGILVISTKVAGKQPIATNGLPAGLYVVKIITGKTVVTRSLVVK